MKALSLPPEKQHLLDQVVADLSQVSGVAAIVLGGSYASGTQHSASDLDIGAYYAEAAPFSVAEIKRVATGLARPGSSPTVTDFYEWGPWVNGGAWIETEGGKVDFLYRNLDQIETVIQAAQQGIVQHDYDQQPTNGFYSVGYLAETQICIALFDPEFRIAKLKQRVATYPAKLKQKIIADSLWSAEFTLHHARGFAAKGDVYNTAGCLVRALANLTQALFALNERYFLSDKKVMEALAAFRVLPAGYVNQITHLLACPGGASAALSETVTGLEAAWRSVATLAGEIYQPKFVI
jgi:hypothetical protein